MPKPKRVNKTKEQVAWEMRQKSEAQRKRKIVGERLFPLLLEQGKSITHVKNFCKILESDILQTYQQGMSKPLSLLKLTAKLEGQDDEAANAFRKVVEAFADVPIGEALELISGFPQAIDAALNHEDRERPLTDFTWEDGSLVPHKKDA